MTLNKVCGSGLRAVSLAAQIIKAGDADIIVAGGAENMSATAYAMPAARWGARMNNAPDGRHDGKRWSVGTHSTTTTWVLQQKTSRNSGALTREELDEFAVASQQKAEAAIKAGKFKDEIVPVEIPQRKGDPIIFDTDEHPKFGSSMEKVAKLKPAFKRDGGVVTAANASGINDSGAAVVVMSKEKADELGIKPMCTIKSYASAGVDPTIMGIGPVPLHKKGSGKSRHDSGRSSDLIEANEAFAAQSVAVGKDLGFNKDILNVNGGAIALGHPIGASGCRILITLMYEMAKRDAKKGLATLCIGGGQGTAMIVER